MRLRSGCFSMVSVTVALMIPSQPAWSQTAYEGFDLTFPVYDGGTGFNYPWQQGGWNFVNAAEYTASAGSLSRAGLQTSGGRVSGGASNEINGVVRSLAQTIGTDNTTAYLSFLLRPQGTLNNGLFNGFFGLTLNAFQTLFVGKPGGGTLEQYVVETAGGAGQVSTGTSTVVGQTTFLVLKAQFLPGNDIFTLYTNPVPGDPEPAIGAVKADVDLGIVTVLGINSTGAFSIDEIRIGTTFAAVTPRSDVIFANGFDI